MKKQRRALLFTSVVALTCVAIAAYALGEGGPHCAMGGEVTAAGKGLFGTQDLKTAKRADRLHVRD